MPVTAKLSREFYEKFGEKIADELVNWFNQLEQRMAHVEAKMAQLEAKLEQRLAEFRAEIEHRLNEQTPWLLGAWGILLAAVISLWFR